MSPTFKNNRLIDIWESGIDLLDGATMGIRWDGLAIMLKDPNAKNHWEFYGHLLTEGDAAADEIEAAAKAYNNERASCAQND